MDNSNEEHHFTSLNMAEEKGIQSGGLDFLPSNYDYDSHDQTNNSSYTKNSDSESVINLGDDTPTIRHRGKMGTYMDKYGMGWLLDQNNHEIDQEDRLPLLEELDIDVSGIKYKINCVLMPYGNNPNLNRSELKDNPDFWGPLFIVMLFAMLSVFGQLRVVSWIITIWIAGSFLVFLIARVLGGEVTYSQIVGIIGYSLLPLVFMAVLMPLLKSITILNYALKFMGVAWSTYSAATLLCSNELQHKKPLLLYPIFLLYIYFLSVYSGV